MVGVGLSRRAAASAPAKNAGALRIPLIRVGSLDVKSEELMLHEHQSVRDDRHAQHQAAVRQSLGWADAAAGAGEHADALHWLDVVEAVGHELSADDTAKREAWRRALRGASAAEQPAT